jgi:hypothetical protein
MSYHNNLREIKLKTNRNTRNRYYYFNEYAFPGIKRMKGNTFWGSRVRLSVLCFISENTQWISIKVCIEGLQTKCILIYFTHEAQI